MLNGTSYKICPRLIYLESPSEDRPGDGNPQRRPAPPEWSSNTVSLMRVGTPPGNGFFFVGTGLDNHLFAKDKRGSTMLYLRI